MQVISHAEARQSRQAITLHNGTRVWLSYYLGQNFGSDGRPSGAGSAHEASELHPTAYLVEQDANTEIPAHYHRPDQFQLFTDGDGMVGRWTLNPIIVQFAGHNTPYGPIKSGSRGLDYMTLRNGWDPGVKWMPQAREELKNTVPNKRRSHITNPILPLNAAQLEKTQTDCVSHLHEEDGLQIKVYHLAPGQTILGPDPATGRGQFWFVIGGSGSAGESSIQDRSCIFVEPNAAAAQLTASFTALQVIMMQFPRDPL